MGNQPIRRNPVAALVEEIRSEVSKVAEGHDTLARGIVSLEERFSGMEQRFILMEKALTVNNARLDAHQRSHADR